MASPEYTPVQQQLEVMQTQMAKMQSEISQLLALTRSQARLSPSPKEYAAKDDEVASFTAEDDATTGPSSAEREEEATEASRLRRRRLRFFERTKQQHAHGEGG